LVVTADEAVARWAAKPVDLGGGNRFVPLALHPSGVPEVTDQADARLDPELAVLSAMFHGQDADIQKAAQIALAAQLASLGLDEDRYEYQSDFAKPSASGYSSRRHCRTRWPSAIV